MSESLANLQHRESIQTFEFKISNMSINTQWNSWYCGTIDTPIGIDLTDKKTFVTTTLSVYAGTCVQRVSGDDTVLRIVLYRPTSATNVNGKIYVMVTD